VAGLGWLRHDKAPHRNSGTRRNPDAAFMEHDNKPLRTHAEVAALVGIKREAASHHNVAANSRMRIALELLDDGEPLAEVLFVMQAWHGNVTLSPTTQHERSGRMLEAMPSDDRPAMRKFRKMFGASRAGMWTEGS
jgi:hypothetical protein